MAHVAETRPTPARHLLRVLIVEDSPADAELATAMLKRAGYSLSFDIVDSPDTLQERLKQSDYDLVLCDHNLGAWMGTDALEMLQRSAKEIPFIVVTATLGDEAAVDYIKHGATDYVLKHRLDRLPVAVGRALRERAYRDETRRLQERVLCAKREWELTFDTVPDPVFLLTEQCRVRRANRAAVEAFRLGFSQLIGKHWCETLDSGTPHGPNCFLQRMLATSGGKRFDLKLPRSGRTCETSAIAIRDTNGEESGYVCVMHDVTEQKRAAEELRQSEERFRDLFEDAPIAYHEIDREGILRRVNRAECELLGYELGEMLGRPVWHFAAAEVRENAREAFCSKISRQSALVPFQRDYLRRDGARLTLEIHEKLILDERANVTGIRAALLDVSERKKAEDALLRKEQFLSGVFASIQDGLSILDQEMNIVRVNPTMERVFAQAMPLVGKKCWVAYHGRSEPCESCPSRQTIQAGETAHIVIPRDGTEGGWIDLRTFPLLDPVTGEASGIIEYIRDISEQRRLEEHLRQAQKMEAVGRLAGGVAHDFNNLLMVISGYSEMLLDQPEPTDSRQRAAREIRNAASRAASLTRQLLAFSRKQVLQPQVLDLNAVVTNVDKMLRRLIGEDVELVLTLDPALGRVKADPGQIEQVLMNLAVNSRDAMPEGGKLIIETANVELDEDYARRHTTTRPGLFVMLAVSDTGCGMDPETQAHVFEPFFTTKERGKGTGLGLATVYGIVKQSGGHIWVYSEPGAGTAFKIYLSRVTEPADVRQPSEGSLKSIRGTETILVVEDEQAVRELICATLEGAGYTVLPASNGVEALRTAEGYRGEIHLLITDVVMPQMSGQQLVQQLSAIRPGTKILYISGYTDNAILYHGVLKRGMPFLQKPFTTQALGLKVRQILEDTPALRAAGAGSAPG